MDIIINSLLKPLLVIHIAAGFVSLVSGLIAMASRKIANKIHSKAGDFYYKSMSFMTVSAAALTFFEPDRLSLGAAIWSFYLVQTARNAAITRGNLNTKTFKILLIPGLIAVSLFFHGGLMALMSAGKEFQDRPAMIYFVFGLISAIGLALDLSLLLRKNLNYRDRILRHLWRMTISYLLAATSLFLGQQDDVFPFMQGSPILLLPSIFTIGFLVFWLFRVRFAKKWV